MSIKIIKGTLLNSDDVFNFCYNNKNKTEYFVNISSSANKLLYDSLFKNI